MLSALKDDKLSKDKAIERLSRSPRWVWVAMDPESKVLLTWDVGNRTLAMVQGRMLSTERRLLTTMAAPCGMHKSTSLEES